LAHHNIPERKVSLMKKVLVSLVAGAASITGALPVSAGGFDNTTRKDESMWEIVDEDFFDCTAVAVCAALTPGGGVLADLVLIAGMATMLDTCGNGKPFYTLFAPVEGELLPPPSIGSEVGAAVGGIEGTLDSFLEDVLGASVADLQATPDVVRALLNDHLVNGSFSPTQLDLDEITTLTARSGFVLRNENGEFINDLPIFFSEQSCNGWIYFIGGVLDSTPQVATEGLNSLDTPNDGTPGGTNSLPDTV
jgi:hypothetical protein